MCPGTIQLSSEMNVTGLSFDLDCFRLFDSLDLGSCTISGGGVSRHFSGAPSKATFRRISFIEGNGINSVRVSTTCNIHLISR